MNLNVSSFHLLPYRSCSNFGHWLLEKEVALEISFVKLSKIVWFVHVWWSLCHACRAGKTWLAPRTLVLCMFGRVSGQLYTGHLSRIVCESHGSKSKTSIAWVQEIYLIPLNCCTSAAEEAQILTSIFCQHPLKNNFRFFFVSYERKKNSLIFHLIPVNSIKSPV